MSVQRRTAFLPALAIVLIAGLVSACGVKGELEPPPAAQAQPSAQPASESSVRTNSSALERSRITDENLHDVLPQDRPKEWSKKSDRDQERDAKSPVRGAAPQQPFVLDWLL